MRQWLVLYRKEMLDMWRSGKWLWVPAVCILLTVMTPVSHYYMPQILEMAGNLPEGTIIQIPVPKPPEVMAETLSQFGTMGVLILVLASMGIVAGERASGMAAMILVKPVTPASYLTAKWAGLLTLALTGFLAGYGLAWYYTELLIGHVAVAQAAAAFGMYALWLVFILAVTLLMSTWLKGNGAVAAVTLLIAVVLSLLAGLPFRFLQWNPGRLGGHAAAVLNTGQPLSFFGASVGVTLLLSAVALLGAIHVLRRQEFV